MSEWLHLAGDIVEDLVVLRPLGRGGFGEVYLARSVHEEEDEELYAIKALRPTLVQDRGWRERFGREANIWIDLEDHPYVVRAHAVLEVSGRLYIVLDYVHPDASGMNSLGQYLEHRPPDVIQALRWAIQFCLGMEYAYTRGLRSHRDIKPDNILISRGQTVRISDFGIASAGGTPERPPDLGSVQTRSPSEGSRLTGAGTGFGSLLYMPPEQFLDAAGCDERSDIYAFGIVLYQMFSAGRYPYDMEVRRGEGPSETAWRLHRYERPVPLASPLWLVIFGCLQKDPRMRYQGFQALRLHLEAHLKRFAGEFVGKPGREEMECWEWSNKGRGLTAVGRFEEAIAACDKALAMDPMAAPAWNNKGAALDKLGRYGEAIKCFERCLRISPREVGAWNNLGIALLRLGRYEDALRNLDRALALAPQRWATWNNKCAALNQLGRHEAALVCAVTATEIDPKNDLAWIMRGEILDTLGRHEEALTCYDEAVLVDPMRAMSLRLRADCLLHLKRYADAKRAYDQVVEVEPNDDGALLNKAYSLRMIGRLTEAASVVTDVVDRWPDLVVAWHNLGHLHLEMGQRGDSLRCFEAVIRLRPSDISAWESIVELHLGSGRVDEALAASDDMAASVGGPIAVATKAKALLRMGRMAEGIALLETGVRVHGGSGVLWMLLIEADERVGNRAAALEVALEAESVLSGETEDAVRDDLNVVRNNVARLKRLLGLA